MLTRLDLREYCTASSFSFFSRMAHSCCTLASLRLSLWFSSPKRLSFSLASVKTAWSFCLILSSLFGHNAETHPSADMMGISPAG